MGDDGIWMQFVFEDMFKELWYVVLDVCLFYFEGQFFFEGIVEQEGMDKFCIDIGYVDVVVVLGGSDGLVQNFVV